MNPPSGFKPSAAVEDRVFDQEGRLHEFNISRGGVGGIGEANSLYATESEKFGSVAPFLHLNMEKDRPRRNYIVQPGGAILFNPEPEVEAEFPTRQESFGHNTLESAQQPSGTGKTPFQVSDPTRGVG